MANAKQVMGVDIGGSGIKAAIVDIQKGILTTERLRLDTPEPATPESIMDAVKELQLRLKWEGAVGCGFPGLIKGGIVHRAPNLDASWVGFNLLTNLQKQLGVEIMAVGNDADAAGLAEVKFGAGKGVRGTIVMVTLGTGIGTAVFHNGSLLPNTELGHLELNGKDAERSASSNAKARKGWSWKKWGKNVDRYLSYLEYLLGVDRFIIGGGVSKKPEKFFPYLKSVTCPIEVAKMGNLAGIVGAALFAVPKVKALEKRKRRKKQRKK